ncbi:hypothetical protein XH09_22065 [Salmonella enterica subsp. enterica serovar Newport]|nr:hypothetical protein [Salmonella enterica subsp. enterica serovar Newport]
MCKTVFIMTQCEYLSQGMKYLFPEKDIFLKFVKCIEEVKFSYNKAEHILLVLDMSSIESLRKFKVAVDFLNQINSPREIGVLVSKYNSYLTYYISRKIKGKVTFFDSHTLNSGLFQRNFHSWLKGKMFRSMPMAAHGRDSRYGASLKEWFSLVLPLSGESMQEISACINVPSHALYQIRQNALHKFGVASYRQFCELYILGKIHTER